MLFVVPEHISPFFLFNKHQIPFKISKIGLYFIQEGFLGVVVPQNNEAHGLVRKEYLSIQSVLFTQTIS